MNHYICHSNNSNNMTNTDLRLLPINFSPSINEFIIGKCIPGGAELSGSKRYLTYLSPSHFRPWQESDKALR